VDAQHPRGFGAFGIGGRVAYVPTHQPLGFFEKLENSVFKSVGEIHFEKRKKKILACSKARLQAISY
jgi:hypothetical protein